MRAHRGTMTRDRSRNGRHGYAVVVEEPRIADPYERLEALCDPGSLHVIRSTVLPRRGSKRMQAGDGVVGAAGVLAGLSTAAQDQHFAGSLGEAHAETIVRVMQLAGRAGALVVGFVTSGGALDDGRRRRLRAHLRESVKLSGRVPQISIITGVSAGGGAYSPGAHRLRRMTEGSAMFLTGPGVVREVMGEDVDAQELGGPRVHSKNGVCQFVAKDDLEAAALARLLGFLPSHAGEEPPHGGPAACRRSTRRPSSPSSSARSTTCAT